MKALAQRLELEALKAMHRPSYNRKCFLKAAVTANLLVGILEIQRF